MSAERLQQIGSAAAGIAHDINNQLNLIVNHLSLPDVEGALKAVERCSALTSGLLAFCRGESAGIGPVDPASLLRQIVGQLRLPPGIDLVLEIPDSLPPIAADSVSVTRALDNLIRNALAAMADGGILSIRATYRTIEVGDTGPGVPSALARAIFEPFFTTKGEQGTGLGLAIVRNIMRQHGGFVTMESKPGEGARFTLHFRAL